MKLNYKNTISACFIGFIIQAIVNNFVPLLFLTFQSSFDISISKITMLVTINFVVQLIVDILSISFIDRIGYRASVLIAHFFVVIGLVSLAILPDALSNPYMGFVISVVLYAIGGGLLEVLLSPMVEACPTDHKEKTMSMLHSFYCWGHVGVVLLSTLLFKLIGIENWRFIALIWAIIPIINFIIFTKVPITELNEGHEPFPLKSIMLQKAFWIFMLLMICSGACEQSVSQWASTFAEKGLGVNKTIGDLAGPMMFATLMGLSRLIYGKYGEKIDLNKFMIASAILCVASYLIISLTNSPILGLIGCGLCGMSVGIMWPGTFSSSAKTLKGGTAIFALLALGGDLGCSAGPTLVGLVSGAFNDNLKIGILFAGIFPILFLVGLFLGKRNKKIASQ